MEQEFSPLIAIAEKAPLLVCTFPPNYTIRSFGLSEVVLSERSIH